MIHYCRECGDEIALDDDSYPYCFDCADNPGTYEPGDDEDFDPLEDHEIGWDDVHDGYDPWGYER